MKRLLALIAALALIPSLVFATALPTGNGYAGDLSISSGTTTDNATESAITLNTPSGTASTTVSSSAGFAVGGYVMLIQMVGTGAGNYEFQRVRSISGNQIFFASTTANTYQSSGAQVIKVSEYRNVTMTGGTWTAGSWNGTTGGVLVAFVTNNLLVTGGSITMSNAGFAGGAGFNQGGGQLISDQGNSSSGTGGFSRSANGSGGGGGQRGNCAGVCNGGGGGGGYSSSGGVGQDGIDNNTNSGLGGNTQGVANLSTMFLGAGGGGGNCGTANCGAGNGGTGAGIIYILAASTTISGTASVVANSGQGGQGDITNGGACGGSGAAGTIRLPTRLGLALGSSLVTASGAGGNSTGCSGRNGGAGSNGRIATVSQATVSGTASPSIDTSSTDTTYPTDQQAAQVSLGSSI